MANQFAMKFSPLYQHMKSIHLHGTTIPKWFKPNLNNNTLLRHILYRRSLKMNTFVSCVGAVRSGKSYFCLKYGELFMNDQNKDFDVDKQCSFDLMPFLRWSQTQTNSVYVVDEIQVSMGTREWFDVQHRVFNTFADIQGLRGNLLLMPFPNISFIDKHLRFLINYVVHIKAQGFCHWYKVVAQHHLGKNWLQFIGSIKYKLPSKEVVEKYETMKKKFTDQHLKDSIAILENMDKPKTRYLSPYQYQQFHKQGIIDDDVFSEKMSMKGVPGHEISMIIKSHNKRTETQGYPHQCNNCGYTWTSRVSNPVKCSKCQTRL